MNHLTNTLLKKYFLFIKKNKKIKKKGKKEVDPTQTRYTRHIPNSTQVCEFWVRESLGQFFLVECESRLNSTWIVFSFYSHQKNKIELSCFVDIFFVSEHICAQFK